MKSFHRHRPRPAARPSPAVAHTLERRVLLAILPVTTTADAGPGSLRQAILDANAAEGADRIIFNLGFPPGTNAVYTIRPATPLPDVTGPTAIDATTQRGYSVFDRRPLVELDGITASTSPGAAGPVTGLHFVNATGSSVKGLIISRWSGNGVWLDGGSGITLEFNWVGVRQEPTGVVAGGNGTGVYLRASACRVASNRICANTIGITVGRSSGAGPDDEDNLIAENGIGVVRQGVIMPNLAHGVLVAGGTHRTTLDRNVIVASPRGVTVGVDPPAGALPAPAPRAVVLQRNSLEGLAGLPQPDGIGLDVRDGDVLVGGVVPGTTAPARNYVSGNAVGVRVAGGTARIEGNYIGLDTLGAEARPNDTGILVETVSGMTIGGATPAARNLIAGNRGAGVRFVRPAADPLPPGAPPHRVLGNHFGLNYLGTGPVRNGGPAIELVRSTGVVVGGDDPAARNVISGGTEGVRINGATGTRVVGNYIGTDASGRIDPFNNTGNTGSGVAISGFAVGNAVERNLITFNRGNGILVNSGTGNTFLTNSIYNNSRLAIDLGSDGITPNDPGDVDTGPNDRQNFPDIATAQIVHGQTALTGTVSGPPGIYAYRVQFFHGPPVASPFFTEGKTFLGEVTVTTGADGTAPFAATLPPVTPGQVVTATATWPGTTTRPAQTSEISRGVPVDPPDTLRPRVFRIFVNSTQWSDLFRQHLARLSAPEDQGLGYTMPIGMARFEPLPWSNLNEITIRFTEPVEVARDDLLVRGAAPYTVTSFSHAGAVATWRLDRPVGADNLLLELKVGAAGSGEGVRDLAGNPLSGDPRSRVSVLPGHVSRSTVPAVTARDLAHLRRRYGEFVRPGGTGSADYSPFADIDGNGRINAADVLLARANQRRPLPEPPPVLP